MKFKFTMKYISEDAVKELFGKSGGFCDHHIWTGRIAEDTAKQILGNGHSGVRSPELHFGLGPIASETPVRVEIRWIGIEGQGYHETHILKPGWHTVVLGQPTHKNTEI